MYQGTTDRKGMRGHLNNWGGVCGFKKIGGVSCGFMSGGHAWLLRGGRVVTSARGFKAMRGFPHMRYFVQ